MTKFRINETHNKKVPNSIEFGTFLIYRIMYKSYIKNLISKIVYRKYDYSVMASQPLAFNGILVLARVTK